MWSSWKASDGQFSTMHKIRKLGSRQMGETKRYHKVSKAFCLLRVQENNERNGGFYRKRYDKAKKINRFYVGEMLKQHSLQN